MTADESGGVAWRKLVHPDEAESVREQWTHSRETGRPYEMEVRLRRASDASYRWMLVRAVPLHDDSGKLIRWLGTCTDIDEQKRLRENTTFLAQASAVLSESLDYQGTLAKLAEIVVPRLADWCAIHLKEENRVVPRLLVLTHADRERARQLAKLSPITMNGPRGPYQVVHTGVAELYSEIGDDLIASSARDEEQLRALRHLGLRSAMVLPLQARGRTFGAITLASAESGRHYTEADLAFASNLVERAAYAVDNARLFDESQQAIRSREEFLSIASHELRTPLTALELQVGSLRRAAARPDASVLDKINPKLDTIHRQVERLTKLIDNLLDVSRVMVGRFTLQVEPVDFGEVAEDVARRFREQLTKAGCELRLAIERTCVGMWDRMRLDQILTNLLSNAIKYGQGKPIEIALRSIDAGALLTVRDYGIGIGPEDQGRIFERFERAVSQRHFGGLGLGLWIVKQIVTAMAGQIEVESKVGDGAMFRVTLPKHPPGDFARSPDGAPISPSAELH
jgi:signal transduction histidine kinase